ncbi:MAG: RHS repeat-associated core domain-containing protein, partial [Lachnospiraceae bacterium]|nr:RHS repeat-associated core domain-containing protein [Lachnospiraceae bacterium]
DNVIHLYRKNLQGDITGIYSGLSGELLVSYVYDAWGKVTATDEANTTKSAELIELNPYLYRGYRYDHETGLYYLQSRYYDPETGRWINSDMVIAEVNTSVKGSNLFAYCFNNPVNMEDQTGAWPEWIKDAVKWVAENVAKPVVTTIEKTLSKVDLTYSRGVNLSATIGIWSVNAQFGISMDTKGNIAIQVSLGGGIATGNPGGSISKYQSITNAPNIGELTEDYCQAGGSIAKPIGYVPFYGGGDFIIMDKPDPKPTCFGTTVNVGLGTPGTEGHVEWGRTITIPYSEVNVFRVARFMYNKIMEW